MSTPPKRRRKRKQKPDFEASSTVEWPGRKDGDPILFGYVRVSTNDQDTQRQIDMLVLAGVHPLEIYGDHATGATFDPDVRPGWFELNRVLQAGDALVLAALDRAGRDALGLLNALHDLIDRGVHIRILNMAIDLSTPIGRFLLGIFAHVAQFERELALDRTMSGLQMAKARGVKLGSAKKFTDEVIEAAWEKGGNVEKTAEILKCSPITVIRWRVRTGRATKSEGAE